MQYHRIWILRNKAHSRQAMDFSIFHVLTLNSTKFYFIFLSSFFKTSSLCACKGERAEMVRSDLSNREMGWLGPGVSDTVTSRGIKPHGDSQRWRQSLPRSPPPTAHGNRDTDLRAQTSAPPCILMPACKLNAVAC